MIGSWLVVGLRREEKAAGERLPDRISVGVLVRTFPEQLLDEMSDAADVREVRYRTSARPDDGVLRAGVLAVHALGHLQVQRLAASSDHGRPATNASFRHTSRTNPS